MCSTAGRFLPEGRRRCPDGCPLLGRAAAVTKGERAGGSLTAASTRAGSGRSRGSVQTQHSLGSQVHCSDGNLVAVNEQCTVGDLVFVSLVLHRHRVPFPRLAGGHVHAYLIHR